VILWECCTGLILWNSESITELRRLQLSAPAKSLRDVCPDTVPAALASLVDRLLARPVAERPASAALVRDELRALVMRAELGTAQTASAVRPAIAAAASAYASASAATPSVSAPAAATSEATSEAPRRDGTARAVAVIVAALLVLVGAYMAATR
jgi:hypothetical protein